MNRKVKRLIKDSFEWEEIKFEDLKRDDLFCICNYIDYKDTWELYTINNSGVVWEVTCDPYTHPIYGVWTAHARDTNDTWPNIVFWDMEHLIYGRK